jgi:hypothetical protein
MLYREFSESIELSFFLAGLVKKGFGCGYVSFIVTRHRLWCQNEAKPTSQTDTWSKP